MQKTFDIEINIPKAEFEVIMNEPRPSTSQLSIRKMVISATPSEIKTLEKSYVTVKMAIPWGDSYVITNSIRELISGALLTGWLQGSREAHSNYRDLVETKTAGQ